MAWVMYRRTPMLQRDQENGHIEGEGPTERARGRQMRNTIRDRSDEETT